MIQILYGLNDTTLMLSHFLYSCGESYQGYELLRFVTHRVRCGVAPSPCLPVCLNPLDKVLVTKYRTSVRGAQRSLVPAPKLPTVEDTPSYSDGPLAPAPKLTVAKPTVEDIPAPKLPTVEDIPAPKLPTVEDIPSYSNGDTASIR